MDVEFQMDKKMAFKKYMHIEKYGTPPTEGIDVGKCYIFSKIDGTNGSVWMEEDGKVHCGSRNREITAGNDNHGFVRWLIKQENIYQILNTYSNIRLFGEWLVPHTVKHYREEAWKNFYVFDVFDEERLQYIHYNEYKPILDKFGIEYIPPLAVIKNPTYERLMGLLDKNYYLIPDGEKPGEGIVIKNYEWKNKFGRQVWGKIVRNEFKEDKSKVQPTDIKKKKLVEEEIVREYVTQHLVDKEFAKINNEVGWTSKQIPRLLNTVYYCLVTEEAWNFIKKFKNPTIDFGKLKYMTFNKVKELKPELF